jgi:cell division protein FtsQ
MWDDAKALNALALTLGGMAAVAVVAAVGLWLARQPLFAIREVVLATPPVRASAPHLEAVIRDELSGTFFTMDLDATRRAIGAVPWVRKVGVRRQWPGRLEIAIDEHRPLARWNDTGLVSVDGEIFVATHAGPLPQFRGPDHYAGEIANRYAEWTTVLAPLGLGVAELAVSPRGAWRVRAEGPQGPLSLELGRDDPSGRLSRFVAAYGRTIGALARQGTRVDHVDLRYRNGFAARVPGLREAPAKAGA